MSTLLVIGICLFLSALFSASEMAFVSSNKLKLRECLREKKREAFILQGFYRNPRNFLAVVLICNNLVNITVVALATYFAKESFGIENEWLITLALAPLLIIFAETVPKAYGRQRANQMIYQIAPVLNFFYRLLSPLSRFLIGFGDFLLRRIGGSEKKTPFVTKEEFTYVIEESTRQGVISDEEKRLVEIILNFERIRVGEVMTPLRDVPHIEITKNVWDLKDLARKTNKPFILVYEEIPSIIVGAIYVFDILFERNESRSLTSFLKAPLFVFEDLSAEKTFLKLQQNHQSFAVVLDETREAVGIISIDDLLTF
ncbi:MAG TPA: CNNM domain-containing protein [Candidatus Omnitrophota bacterium]|nr:CNNM domain-containing protein [Candidatus Omnitrophota bacterium]